MRSIFLILAFGLHLFSCNETENSPLQISSFENNSESVYLTRDNIGRPVVAWTENSGDEVKFFYAKSSDDGRTFSGSVAVPVNQKIATHAEGMPKIAFRADGTIFIAYETKSPTSENKYAGAICYITSKDQGESWSTERFIHRDTVAGRSRSYFDIEALPDGEIGASWLDIKLEGKTGRSVLFAKTDTSDTFGDEILIDSSACQCCRTDVYTDVNKNIYVSYRGLRNGAMGKSIRDMMVCSSANGKIFTSPLTISADNWAIDGCPHTGPSLCSNKAGLMTLWYTEGNGNGIYYAHKPENGSTFTSRQLVSSAGRHPQVCSNGDKIAMLWEENVDSNGAMVTTVNYQLLKDGKAIEKSVLTDGYENAFFPVVTATEQGFLVAYLIEKDNRVGVYVTRL